MADKRMFSNKITQSDPFLAMPPSSQNLYFHLAMGADDDGFVNRPRSIMRMVNANEDDMNLLVTRKFVIPFNVQEGDILTNMICVIKHWFIHNNIRNDRKKATNYISQKGMLILNENGSYSLKKTDSQPVDNQVSTNGMHSVVYCSLDKCSLDKCSLEKDIVDVKSTNNVPFRVIIDYLNERTGKRFKVTDEVRKKIKARYTEGFQLQDFKDVIDKKCVEWTGTEFQKYIQPSTLFGNKFQNYLNQEIIRKKSSNPFLDMIDEGVFDDDFKPY